MKNTHQARPGMRQPFERRFEAGLRLNEVRTEGRWRASMVGEIVELTAAQSLLLVLETATWRATAWKPRAASCSAGPTISDRASWR